MHARRRASARRGSILVLSAIMMVFIVGIIALAVDTGVITLARTQLQCAADSAAIAAADSLSTGTSAAQTAAQTFAQDNKAGGAAVSLVIASDVTFGTWSTTTNTFTALSGAAISSANAVQVTCRMANSRSNALNLFFAPLFGLNHVDVSATATATKATSSSCSFVGLSYVNISGGTHTDSYDSSAGAYSAGTATSNGNVCSNGTITMSGGLTVIKGNATPGVGNSVSMSGGSSVTGTTTAETTALSEPAINSGNASTTNNNSNIPTTTHGHAAVDGSGNFNVSGGDSVTIPAGTYYLKSMTLSGGSTITLSGAVVIYVTGNADLSGGSVTNTGDIPANMQLNVMGTTLKLSGGSDLYAEVYAPTADITQSGGSSSFYGSMIGKSLTLSGGGGLHADKAIGGASNGAQLVQ